MIECVPGFHQTRRFWLRAAKRRFLRPQPPPHRPTTSRPSEKITDFGRRGLDELSQSKAQANNNLKDHHRHNNNNSNNNKSLHGLQLALTMIRVRTRYGHWVHTRSKISDSFLGRRNESL